MANERYDQLLKIMERHGLEMSHMSQTYEKELVKTYQQAAAEVNERVLSLQNQIDELPRGVSTGRLRWRMARESGLLDSIESRISELGGATGRKVTEGWGKATEMARAHMDVEMQPFAEQVRRTSGISALAVDFTALDTAAIELGLGTALADTSTLTSSMQVALRREIQAGIAAGQNMRAIAGRVDDIVGVGGGRRAEAITRWSVVKGYNLSRQASMESTLMAIPTMQKQWLAQADERTCPHCLAQHGTTVEVTSEFDPENTYAETPPKPHGGFLLVPPLHPLCRCLIVAWDESFRAYTDPEAMPELQHEQAREMALSKGFWRALGDPGVPRRLDTVGRVDRAFEYLLAQPGISARVAPVLAQGDRAWIGISQGLSSSRGGMVSFVMESTQGLRVAQFDVQNWEQARVSVLQLLDDMESGLAAETIPEITMQNLGGFARLVEEWKAVSSIQDYTGPPGHLILSRDEVVMLNALDDFLDRVLPERALELADDLDALPGRSVRGAFIPGADDVRLHNFEYVRDDSGFWRLGLTKPVCE